MLNLLESEQAVNSAKKDFSQLRNVDRPLYDLLLTQDSGFKSPKEAAAPIGSSNALAVVDGDLLVGDVPRLVGNLEESSFLTADQSHIQKLYI